MIASLVYSFLLWIHPIHISVTEINYNEKSKSLQITSRIFIDEMELGVRAQRKETELDILDPKNGVTTEQLVKNYLASHIKVKIDGKPAKINFLGHEKEDISFVSYLEIENVKKLKTIEVFVDVITEIHDDQSNLVHVTYKSSCQKCPAYAGKHLRSFHFYFKVILYTSQPPQLLKSCVKKL